MFWFLCIRSYFEWLQVKKKKTVSLASLSFVIKCKNHEKIQNGVKRRTGPTSSCSTNICCNACAVYQKQPKELMWRGGYNNGVREGQPWVSRLERKRTDVGGMCLGQGIAFDLFRKGSENQADIGGWLRTEQSDSREKPGLSQRMWKTKMSLGFVFILFYFYYYLHRDWWPWWHWG